MVKIIIFYATLRFMAVQQIKLAILILVLALLTVLFNWHLYGEFGFDISGKLYLFVILLLLFDIFVWRNFCKSLKEKEHVYFFLWWLVILFIGIIISTIGSVLPHQSLWGTRFRHAGLVDFLFYFLLSAEVILIIKNLKQVKILIKWIIIASFVVIGFGLLQFFNLHYWEFTVFDKGITSVMAHPSFYGAYLAMMIPITLGYLIFLFTKSKNHRRVFAGKVFLFSLLILQIISLLLTETRAAWIAAVLAMVIFLFLNILYFWGIKRTIYFAITALAIVAVGGLFLFNSAGSLPSKKLNPVFDYQSGSGALRLIWWENAIDAIKDRPFLGYGADSQSQVFFPRYKPLEIQHDSSGLKLNDRAHNESLDLALMFGLPWLFIYYAGLVWLIFIGVKLLLKKHRLKRGRDVLIISVISSLVAYNAQGFFSFSVPILYIYYFLFLAILAVLINKGSQEPDDDKLTDLPQKSNTQIWRVWLAIFTVILTIVLIIRPAIANYLLKTNKDNLILNNFTLEDISSQVLKFGSHTSGETVFRLEVIDLYLNLFNQEENLIIKKYLIQQAEDQLLTLQAKQPGGVIVLLYAGKVYFHAGDINPDSLTKAQLVYSSLIERSPNFPWSYLYRSDVLAKKKDFITAIDDLEKVLDIYSKIRPESKARAEGLNNLRSEVYRRLGNIYTTMNNLDEAREAYEQVIALVPFSYKGYQGLAAVYSFEKEWQKAWQINLQAVKLYPTLDVLKNQIHYGLKAGELAEARIYLRRALWLADDDPELINFKNEIGLNFLDN